MAINMSNVEILFKQIENNDLTNFSLGYKNINNTLVKDSTALTCAVRKANTETVAQIIKFGADINVREKGGATPLLLAISLGRSEIVKFLIRSSANIKLRDSYDTPLTLAVKEDHLDIVEFLIDNGADVEDCDIKGLPPLFGAIKSNNLAVLDLLLRKEVGKDTVDSSNNTPLIAAIRSESSIDVIMCLLKQKPDVNASRNEKTPLAWAAEKGNIEVVANLLKNGANINTLSEDGNTALATAVQFKNSEVVKYLVVHNANVCKVGENGGTPLLYAVQNKDLDTVKYLLDCGAQFIVDTVFLDAIKTKNVEVVRVLTQRGAIKDREHLAAGLVKACEVRSFEVAQFLIEEGAKMEDVSIIIKFLEEGDFKMVKLLTENCAGVKKSDENGYTVLTKCVEMESFEMVKYFLARGVGVNEADARGVTPLEIAASNNDFQTFQYLVDCGATIDEDDQTKNPKLIKYYRVARENSVKTGKSHEICSNQEEATDAI